MCVFCDSDTSRTATSKQSPLGHYPSSRDSRSHQTAFQDPYDRRSPTRDPHSYRSSTRDPYSHRSPTRDPSSRRSPTRDKRRHRHYPQQQQQQYFPQIQAPPSAYDQVRATVPIQYISSIGLPLLRLGGPSIIAPPMITQSRLPPPPPPVTVYPSGAMQISTMPRPPMPMLHLATQLPPPAALSPQATRLDRQKLTYVQNMMHQYADGNRPRLQLLQMRPHPRTTTTTDLHVPMPAPNGLTRSSDTKIDTGIQVEVPRQDGFLIEPGLFQVSFHSFNENRKLFILNLHFSHFYEKRRVLISHLLKLIILLLVKSNSKHSTLVVVNDRP